MNQSSSQDPSKGLITTHVCFQTYCSCWILAYAWTSLRMSLKCMQVCLSVCPALYSAFVKSILHTHIIFFSGNNAWTSLIAAILSTTLSTYREKIEKMPNAPMWTGPNSPSHLPTLSRTFTHDTYAFLFQKQQTLPWSSHWLLYVALLQHFLEWSLLWLCSGLYLHDGWQMLLPLQSINIPIKMMWVTLMTNDILMTNILKGQEGLRDISR